MMRMIARDETGTSVSSPALTSRIFSSGRVSSSQRKMRRPSPSSPITRAAQRRDPSRPPRMASFPSSLRSAADSSGSRLWAETIRASSQLRPSRAKATWTELIPGTTSQFSRPKRRITGWARLAIPGSPVARRTTWSPASRRTAMVSMVPSISMPESILSAAISGKSSCRRRETMRTSAPCAAARAAGVM